MPSISRLTLGFNDAVSCTGSVVSLVQVQHNIYRFWLLFVIPKYPSLSFGYLLAIFWLSFLYLLAMFHYPFLSFGYFLLSSLSFTIFWLSFAIFHYLLLFLSTFHYPLAMFCYPSLSIGCLLLSLTIYQLK